MDETPKKPGDMFALIVGINNYEVINKLGGAVNDAEEFKNYLMAPRKEDIPPMEGAPPQVAGLGIPCGNIKLLRDAKRADILRVFQSHLIENPDIPERGATMIFYFAGHGTRVESENKELPGDGWVEALCPVDLATGGSGSDYIHPIPDYVLGHLLHSLAERKGNNIIVILDSCHSGGMGREADVTIRRHTISDPRVLPARLDSELFGTGPIAHRLWAPFTASFVLLAACSQDKQAYESLHQSRGYFTEQLLAALRKADHNDTTPYELIDDIQLPNGQKPVCIGANRHRLLFCPTEYPLIGPRRVLKADGNGRLWVSIGAIEGVCAETEFEIYEPPNKLLCTVVPAIVPEAHSTVLTLAKGAGSIGISVGSRVVLKNLNNSSMTLHVHSAPDFQHTSALFPKDAQGRGAYYKQQASTDGAHIRVRSDGANEIIIDRLALTTNSLRDVMQKPAAALGSKEVEKVKQKAVTEADKAKPTHGEPSTISGFASDEEEETHFSVEALDLRSTFHGIAHFHFHLRHRNKDVLLPGFSLEMYRLQGEDKNTTTIGDNMIEGATVRFLSEKDAQYGFKICNTSDLDLFPYLFYFDPDNYTISCWYEPENKNDRGPLHAKEKPLSVGIGSQPGFEFNLGEKQNASSGFLKLFVSTRYVDLDSIVQETSPLTQEFRGWGRLEGRRVPDAEELKWNAVVVRLTMSRE
ncbi:caspase domain-containing protein [Mycena olivaceomarginata]|nr:caspase domain-containing protein [Mycena olivaceomarginata]